MSIPTYIHPRRISFQLPIGPGKTLDRFVYAYVIYGERQIGVIDAGVASAYRTILDDVQRAGRRPEEIASVVLTHAHPDHIGGLRGLKAAVGCKVAAHRDAIPWVENVELQCRERPVPGFHSLVEGAVPVDLSVADGDHVSVGNELTVVHCPGHARGHICLHSTEEGILFTGDAILAPGGLPIYEDPLASLQSLRRMKGIAGLQTILSSWSDPDDGDPYAVIDAGIGYIREVHRIVLEERAAYASTDPTELTRRVLCRLRLPESLVNPILVQAIMAHLPVSEHPDLQEA